MKLIMLTTAMEHGGNLLHRHFDNHPSLFTYPFESQTGTKYSSNVMSYYYPVRYFWPEFPEGTSFSRAYDLMWDEELRCLLRVPERSKFKDCGLKMSEKERKDYFLAYCGEQKFSRRLVVEAYFVSAFQAWDNRKRSDKESFYVGYNPGMVGDTDKIFKDFPDAHMIYVIRNPFSAYADYLKRPYPQQTLEEYCGAYNVGHQLAYNYSQKYAGNFHLITLESFLKDKKRTLEPVLDKIGVEWNDSLLTPSFNGHDLSDNLPPWGTVEKANIEYNRKLKEDLCGDTRQKIENECRLLLQKFYLTESNY